MNTNDLNIAKKYKEHLIELGVPIDAVIVFGSRVKGNTNKWSDLDICVVSPLFDVDRISERSFLMNVGRRMSLDIEPHPMSTHELNNKFNPLANEVRKYGITI